MPNVEEVRQVLKLAAREAKANRAANCTLYQQTLFILSSGSAQHQRRREYHQALVMHTAWRVLKLAGSIKEAWSSLHSNTAHESEPAGNTPASNTGVTNSGASVPIEYFTRGK